MPRKAKDEELNKIEKNAVVTTKSNTNVSKKADAKSSSIKKKTATSKNAVTKKESSSTKINAKVPKNADTKSSSAKKKTATSKNAVTKKENSSTKSNAKAPKKADTKSSSTKKKTSTSKNFVTKKENSVTKKAISSKETAKKVSKNTRKKANTSKVTKKASSKKVSIPVEYYDLPVSYNNTVVKILAQTPFCLFVYWEISEKDKLKLEKQYGENFFKDTKPYLEITNENMNYSFETEINDYANSWYIHINDSNCKYSVKLIRKPVNNNISNYNSPIYIMSSNKIEAPNDHILFDKLGKSVFFRNVKTDIVIKKDISSISFISNIGRIYNIYDLYKEIYKNELNGDELGTSLSSSQFSSNFK